ncbi:MAG: DUF6291 domain-containing protein [Dysgonomonas sp.]
MTKKSFLIYKSFYEPIKSLSDEQMGRLFRSLFDYQINNIDCIDSDILMAYLFFKNQFILDERKYDKIVERNRNNGLKGGRPKNPDNPVGSKKAEKEKDNDNGKDNENIELIYNSYPTRCIVGGRSTGKSSKCKDKIKTLLKTLSSDKLIETIKWYVDDCKKTNTYMKNFYTFLNNMPEIPDEYKPISTNIKPVPNELQ